MGTIKSSSGYPDGAVPVSASSGNVAAAVAAATLTPPAGKTMYLLGVKFSSTGSTAAAVVNATITGVVGGTITLPRATVAGATLQNADFDADFQPGLPASAPGTAIVVTLPSLGAGNTNAGVFAYGYYL